MLSVGALGGVAATSVSFTNQEVPKYQEYEHLLAANKSTDSAYGDVKLSAMDVGAVTFSAASVSSGNYSTGTVVSSTTKEYAVQYAERYTAGTPMVARLRNHSWSLNRGFISGTFDYK